MTDVRSEEKQTKDDISKSESRRVTTSMNHVSEIAQALRFPVRNSPRMSRCEGCQLGCAVVRIVLTSFCRRLCGCKQFQPRPEYSVICIGLSGAGKSSLLAALSNEATDGLEPTAGFSVKAVGLTSAILNVHELGGNDTVRRYWSHYYSNKQALLFVVDASGSLDEIKAAALEFHSALSHPDLCTLPVLLVLNKRDLQAESDELSIFVLMTTRVVLPAQAACKTSAS
ncbi:ADP-ribosylation factor-like protein 15 isoform X2 [Oscarella lobularis]|uniref:ADP-ribosylation factor-like protein 15 isoform X2 n=1 Tax=Oscarella lobularis TaxID=121494 RepID=UPI0033142C04